MNNIILIYENVINGYNKNFLNIVSTIAVLCGIFVIISKNPIVSVLFLIGLFLMISVYLMMLGINFIGLSYLLVYVGAVSILFLFILMLINVRVSELVGNTSNSIPLAILTGIIFNSTVYEILASSDYSFSKYSVVISSKLHNIYEFKNMTYSFDNIVNIFKENYFTDISHVSSYIWDGNLSDTNHITTLGNILYTSYPMWLIITSIVLLLAMVGAIVITIKQKH